MRYFPPLGLALGLLVTSPALATDPWTREDTYWELAYAAMVTLDCNQSSQIQALGRTERNPLLPRRPSPRTMQAICIGSVVGHVAVSYVLPAKWRRGFQAVTVTLETAVVVDNYYRAGIRFKF